MKYYDMELIDISDKIENFVFTKVSEKDLLNIKNAFKDNGDILDFTSKEGSFYLLRKFFRGCIYIPHVEPKKTVQQEVEEGSVKVGEIKKKEKKYV